ncbi:Hypothetical protein (plasmid) [Pseudomonas putida]|nr:Hypothetical protein [Pseudomonas putida]
MAGVGLDSELELRIRKTITCFGMSSPGDSNTLGAALAN